MSQTEIFNEAVKLPAGARAGFLQRVCGADRELREEVESLLRAHDAPDTFLRDSVERTAEYRATAERPGAVIGPYKLLEQVGEGGFGVVYVAEQTHPVRRKVALKVLKPGMDTRQVVARFEAERQALALMDHPHIARVFDGGTTESGRPFFVMELVKGAPITDHCDRNHLPLRERLELFVSVCAAVQHAHQKGIIHRDLKPSNVLVSRYDTTAVVKVIDFGVAKALGQELTDKTLHTGVAQMIGTPLYMSPEQAGMSDLDVDTRSDVYSLGVLLYELLTGTTPFEKERFKTVGYDEIRRIIREEEPPKPSTRLSTLAHAGSTLAEARGADPRRLSKLFRGELDWVVMKALEKDRNRRYETAAAFAADVQRYQADEPVQACPPSAWYRVRKFARRNRAAVTVGAVVAAALVAGTFGTTWGWVRATNAEASVRDEARQKDAALTDAQDQLFAGLVSRSRAVRVSGGVGQRFETLSAVRKAAAIRATPELRDSATAALVLTDLELAREWGGWPDGTMALSFDAGFDRFARLHRDGELTVGKLTDGGEEVQHRLTAAGGPMFGPLALSPDGRFVAYGHTLTEHATWAGVQVWRLDGPASEVLLDEPAGVFEGCLAFHPDGRQMAIGHPDRSVSVYDLPSGRRAHRMNFDFQPGQLQFHPKDHRLAVGGGPTVRILDTEAGRDLPAPRHPPDRVYGVTWHPDGRRLAVSCSDTRVYLLDPDGPPLPLTPVGFGGMGMHPLFNHAGDRLVTAGWGAPATVWEVGTGRPLLSLRDNHRLQFSPDDRLFGYSTRGTKVQLWRTAFGREYRTLHRRGAGPLDRVHRVVVHPNGRTVAVGDQRWLAFFDPATGEELGSVRMDQLFENCPVGYADPAGDAPGGWMTGGTGGLLLWPEATNPDRTGVVRIGPPRLVAPGLASGHSTATATSLDGRVLAVPQGNSAVVIDRSRPGWRRILGPQFDVRYTAVSPDGRWVFTGSHWPDGRSKAARVWDLKSEGPPHDLPLGGSTRASFSPDGRWLLTMNESAGNHLWEVGTWQEVRRFEPGFAAFSPDSRLLALAENIGVVRLVEAETGREVARLTAPERDWCHPCGFSPDGTRLFTNNNGPGVAVWDLRAIRAGLKELGLDWDWPEFPPPGPAAPSVRRVEVVTEVLSPEEQARERIARYAAEHAAAPDRPARCNNLAWAYLIAPEPLRDVKAALPLAEKAVKLAPNNAVCINTLGVAYCRAGRYREAVEILRPNLDRTEDKYLAFDLYFLAMCHHRLGETAQAKADFAWAVRWERTQTGLTLEEVGELKQFRAEAAVVLGLTAEVAPPPREK